MSSGKKSRVSLGIEVFNQRSASQLGGYGWLLLLPSINLQQDSTLRNEVKGRIHRIESDAHQGQTKLIDGLELLRQVESANCFARRSTYQTFFVQRIGSATNEGSLTRQNGVGVTHR